MEVFITPEIVQELKIYGDSSPVHEVCGAFIGTKIKNEWHIEKFIPLTNVIAGLNGKEDYQPHPEEWLNVIKETTHYNDDAKYDFIGVYHTHPNNKPYPSITDVREAGYKGIYIIYSPKYKTFGVYYYNGDREHLMWVPAICHDIDERELVT
ncbi:hypothetical protein HN682_04335 [Candidatus Peregrinibacteria bacterium]|jgi:proteasome lid subunit RPN8/RPN11|nr:hypothetical protein [Candidatus Peregrinibacteria bacterium]